MIYFISSLNMQLLARQMIFRQSRSVQIIIDRILFVDKSLKLLDICNLDRSTSGPDQFRLFL